MGGDQLVGAVAGDQLEKRLGDASRAAELADGITTSADVEATKPRPDLVLAAIERAAGAVAVYESVAALAEHLDETPLT
jgi:hypothetical protein